MQTNAKRGVTTTLFFHSFKIPFMLCMLSLYSLHARRTTTHTHTHTRFVCIQRHIHHQPRDAKTQLLFYGAVDNVHARAQEFLCVRAKGGMRETHTHTPGGGAEQIVAPSSRRSQKDSNIANIYILESHLCSPACRRLRAQI